MSKTVQNIGKKTASAVDLFMSFICQKLPIVRKKKAGIIPSVYLFIPFVWKKQNTKCNRLKFGRRSARESGFSLIEVLAALLVLSIGLFGLVMLQGLRLTTDSYQRTQATLLAYDLMDRMRANKVGADAGAYCLTAAAPANPCTTTAQPARNNCGDTGGCASKEELAKYDLYNWYELQKDQLSINTNTHSSVSRRQVATSKASGWEYTITMRWYERDLPITQVWVVEI